MQEATLIPTTTSDSSEELARGGGARRRHGSASRSSTPARMPPTALAPGTARRAALDDALAEMAAGRAAPSSRWKVRYGLMLGLERVLATEAPETSTGTELRRHQIDALTGMLTELIAATQRAADENGNGGNGHAAETTRKPRSSRTTTTSTRDSSTRTSRPSADRRRRPGSRPPLPLPAPDRVRQDDRRRRVRRGVAPARGAHPHAPPAARLAVPARPHDRGLRRPARAGDREGRRAAPRPDPITIQTYAWFARHGRELSREAYQLVICDEAHTALGEKTSAAIRAFSEPLYIGMTATEQLIAKQVSDVFPASVDDLPLADAARRGLIAPLRCLRVPPVAAINSVPIVGGDFEERALAAALDHQALNQAAASLYRDRFGPTPGIVYAAGVEHAYNLAQEFRAAGLKATAVSGRTPPRELAETLAAYERGEINVLVNAQLLAEGWNSPRATVCMHLAPTASRRVYQQRIGRIMRMHPRKEAGVVVDFVPKAATHAERVISLHSLLDADFYREGARVTPAPRRRSQRRARRRLSPAPWLVPVTPDVRRRLAVIQREWQRVDPKFLDDDEQRFWATIAGRQIRFDQRAEFARKFAEGRAGKGALETFLAVCAAENPNRRLRMTALADRVGDDGRARRLRRPRHARHPGAAVGEGPSLRRPRAAARDRRGQGERAGADPRALDLAAGPRRAQDARPQGRARSSPRRSGCSARSPTRAATATRRTSPSSSASRRRCHSRSAPRCSPPPRATRRGANGVLDQAREDLGPIAEIANALADNLPAPKAPTRKSRRRRRKNEAGVEQAPPRRGRGSGAHGWRPSRGGAGSEAASDAGRSRSCRVAARSAAARARRVAVAALLRSRSRRKRVSSAASASPLGSSPSSVNSSIVSHGARAPRRTRSSPRRTRPPRSPGRTPPRPRRARRVDVDTEQRPEPLAQRLGRARAGTSET